MNPTDPNTLLPCPTCGASLHFRRTHNDRDEYFYVCGHLATVTNGFPADSTLAAELARAQADLKELGERFDGLAKAHEAMIPHQVELRHERDAAVAELADVKPDRDRWEKLAREAAKARLAAQAEAAAMRAERDEAREFKARAEKRCAELSERVIKWQRYGVPKAIELRETKRRIGGLIAERDAANALVDRLAGALEGARSFFHEAGIPCQQIEAALAEVAKSFSPRTTENTKPQ